MSTEFPVFITRPGAAGCKPILRALVGGGSSPNLVGTHRKPSVSAERGGEGTDSGREGRVIALEDGVVDNESARTQADDPERVGFSVFMCLYDCSQPA